jgi:hypothetical protein
MFNPTAIHGSPIFAPDDWASYSALTSSEDKNISNIHQAIGNCELATHVFRVARSRVGRGATPLESSSDILAFKEYPVSKRDIMQESVSENSTQDKVVSSRVSIVESLVFYNSHSSLNSFLNLQGARAEVSVASSQHRRKTGTIALAVEESKTSVCSIQLVRDGVNRVMDKLDLISTEAAATEFVEKCGTHLVMSAELGHKVLESHHIQTKIEASEGDFNLGFNVTAENLAGINAGHAVRNGSLTREHWVSGRKVSMGGSKIFEDDLIGINRLERYDKITKNPLIKRAIISKSYSLDPTLLECQFWVRIRVSIVTFNQKISVVSPLSRSGTTRLIRLVTLIPIKAIEVQDVVAHTQGVGIKSINVVSHDLQSELRREGDNWVSCNLMPTKEKYKSGIIRSNR